MEQQIKTIRIFISSTFKDMHSERDYLVKYVFPELKERCIKKGLSLVDVDLRWGVTEEEAEQGKSLEICLDEIENCRPFFVGILGERYGCTPDRYQVPDYEKYDWLKKFEKGHSITALEIFHGVLNKKTMKPRAFFYFRNPDYIKDVPKLKQNEVFAESDISAKKLFHLKEEIRDTFKAYNIPGHVLENYPCNFKGLKINLHLLKDSLSLELSEQDFKLLERSVGKDNLIENNSYKSLNRQQKNIVDKYSYVYLDGLEEFGNEVLENLWKAICEEHPDENMVTDPLLIELAYHQRFMNSRIYMFIGREDILAKIADYINNPSICKPLVVTGEPGSGKSSLIAIAAQCNRDKPTCCFNIIRFIGASPASLDINKLVQSIIRETAFHFEITVDEKRIIDIKVLYEYFREVLFTASNRGKLTLFIDAVNQLLPQFDPHYLVWLPKHLPENVKIVISSIESEYTKNAKKHEFPFVQVGELSPDNGKKIIVDTLEEYRKKLNEKQLKMVLSKTDAVKPLYLKVACEELRVFPSFELINSRIAMLPNTIEKLFIQFLERLETDHNPFLVKDALCLIESSMYGLLESELLELLKPNNKEKLPINIWAKFYRSLSPYLMNVGNENKGLLEFYHLQLSMAVKTRYINSNETAIFYYKKLADYGCLNYKLKNDNIINTVLHTGIYLYKSLKKNTLYYLLKDIFTSETKNYSLYEIIPNYLFDWVVNNYEFESETILKTVTLRLTQNDFPFQFGVFLDNKGRIFGDRGSSQWAMDFFKKQLKIARKWTTLVPANLDFKRNLSISLNCVGDTYQDMGEVMKALKFFEKSLRVREELVALVPESTDFRNILVRSFLFVGNIYQKIGEGYKALGFFERYLEGTRELVALEPTSTKFISNQLSSYHKMGQIYQKMGEGEKALEFFEKSLKGMEELVAAETTSTKFKRNLSVISRSLGNIYRKIGNEQKALEFHKRSLMVLEELVAMEPERTDFKSDLSSSFNSLGDIYQTMGNEQKALEFYKRSLLVREELVALEPERTDFKSGLSSSFNIIGTIFLTMGEMPKALEFFEKSLKIREDLVTLEPVRTDFKSELSMSINNVAWIYQKIGEGPKAMVFFEKQKTILEQLVLIEPARTDFRSDLSNGYLQLGQFYQKMGEGPKALDYFKKSLEGMEELVAIEPSRTDFRSDLSFCHSYIGQIFQPLGEVQIALEFFTKQKNILEELTNLEPARTDFRSYLSTSYCSIGSIYQTMGEGQRALEFFERQKKILEALITQEPTRTDFRSDLSSCHSYIGQIFQTLGEVQIALEFFTKQKNILEELTNLEPARTDFRSYLSTSYCNIGSIYQTMGEGQRALEFFEKSLIIREQLVALESSRTDFRSYLSTSYSFIGQTYYSEGEVQRALEFFKKQKNILEELATLEPRRTDFRSFLSTSYCNIGSIYQTMGKGERALEFFIKQKNILEELTNLESARTDFRSYLSTSYSFIGQIYYLEGEVQRALEFFTKQKNILEELIVLEPGRKDLEIYFAQSNWNNYLVSEEDEKILWLNKIKAILEPLVNKGIKNALMFQLWEKTKEEVTQLFNAKRTKAAKHFIEGNYQIARQLLEELLQNNFEILSTRMHLARLALITDNYLEVVQHINEVWSIRNEAKNYVLARILWFKITLAYMNNSSIENNLGQLKTLLQKEDAFMEWTMKPVMDHLVPKITPAQHQFLIALVDALSNKQNLEKLNEFSEWRNSVPKDIS